MFQGIGLPELLVIAFVIILIFGVGRISKVGGELGKGIRAFRDGLSGKDEDASAEKDSSRTEPPA